MGNRIRIGLVVSSVSEIAKRADLPALIKEHLDPEAYEPLIMTTGGPGHAVELTKELIAAGCARIVAVGGDGTVNEVARTLIGAPQTALGIVPAGSGNGLARHLGIPLDPVRALRALNDARIAAMDYGTANGVPFFCTCGIGFDARVGYAYARGGARGFFAYLKSMVGEFFRYRSRVYEFTSGGAVFKERAFIVAFANAGQYGYDAYISPEADIQDGLIDVFILKPFPVQLIASLVLRLMRKNIDGSEFVRILRTDEVSVRTRRRNRIQYDGESALAGRRITVRVCRKGLLVLVPPTSPLRP